MQDAWHEDPSHDGRGDREQDRETARPVDGGTTSDRSPGLDAARPDTTPPLDLERGTSPTDGAEIAGRRPTVDDRHATSGTDDATTDGTRPTDTNRLDALRDPQATDAHTTLPPADPERTTSRPTDDQGLDEAWPNDDAGREDLWEATEAELDALWEAEAAARATDDGSASTRDLGDVPRELRGGSVDWLPFPSADPYIAAASASFTAIAAAEVREPAGRVVIIDRLARLAAHHDGLVATHILRLHRELTDELEDAEMGHDATVTELRAALRLTRRSAERLVEDALAVERHPRLLAAWVEGIVDRPRVRAVCDALASLTDAEADAIVDEILPLVETKTTGELRAWLRRLAFATDPAAAQRRYEEAVEERRVEIRATPEGTGVLSGFDLAAEDAVAAFQRIDQLARAAHDGERSIDQRRADVLVDLLLGRADRSAAAVELTLHADVATLAGISDAPGELAGFGPIVADLTRRLAEIADPLAGGYRYRIDDDDLPVALGRTRRRPTAGQRRTVVLRDHTCIFPGCRTPAHRCDLDHRVRWIDGGATTIEQLVALCRHDHGLRHRLGWQHRPTDDGDHVWTSPTGRTYTTTGRDP